jgi:hypothetical protein
MVDEEVVSEAAVQSDYPDVIDAADAAAEAVQVAAASRQGRRRWRWRWSERRVEQEVIA